ncbi:hypothetical protein [Halapricum hydrolyticum]|uniref:Uncharacterized protein n=1 Tax=Halapricum hydrolyticum TaxID=2979991 RepID=A0AAE3IG09_9EURY|nr:hypothetical protein [Halapricum hydrolyticum]MCU4718995.1 hypothetical protein [Halapricum hydrolyticum]MCU4727924.1 hypothetical protein [Halapricum hydrolyticum]
MERAKAIRDRLADSPVALGVAGVVLLGALAAVLVSQIGFPPREALFTTGIAVFVLLMVAYDWYARQ